MYAIRSYYGQSPAYNEILTTLSIVFVFIVAIVASWLPFLYYGKAPIDSLFEVVSAIGTVGLSSGITNTGLPSFLKAVLCLDMLMGRLEVIAILILFYPRTWIVV